MNLFSDYIQPVTAWLHANPRWGLLFTFLISLSESFAIIGAIIPGTVMMTAIGILAGSGVMRIDLTLLAAILGAIAGDSLSYLLGYHYRDKLLDIWPFKKYPNWLTFGKDFFKKHGGKSVLLGRFIGPLRALTPIIAGMMHMKQGRFLLVNVISAIAWSLLYVLPGVLIGTASTELSPEAATRLFIMIILMLAGLWFLSLILKYIVNKTTAYLKKNLHPFWLNLKKHPTMYRLVHLVTPDNEVNHFQTALLLNLSFLSGLGFVLLLCLQLQGDWISALNVPIHTLLKSFHSASLKQIFTIFTQLTSMTTLACLFLMTIAYFVLSKQVKSLMYLSSSILFSFILSLIFTKFIHNPPPQDFIYNFQLSFPAISMTMATAFYGFIYFYFTTHYNFLNHILRAILFSVLGLSGIAALFLGDYWFSDLMTAFCAGAWACAIHCLIFRKLTVRPHPKNPSLLVLISMLFCLLLSTSLSMTIHYKTLLRLHTEKHEAYFLSEDQWWNQQTTILPYYLRNRLAKPISLFNIQYAGDLEDLENSLIEHRWVAHQDAFFKKLMQRINQQSGTVQLPLLELLYNNKHPDLMMTLNDKQSQLVLELRLWASDYYLREFNQIIWIGNIRMNQQKDKKTGALKSIDPLKFLLPSLTEFKIKKIKLSFNTIKLKKYYPLPYLLLIKNKH